MLKVPGSSKSRSNSVTSVSSVRPPSRCPSPVSPSCIPGRKGAGAVRPSDDVYADLARGLSKRFKDTGVDELKVSSMLVSLFRSY